MIKGIGIDITHISRFKKLLNQKFFEKSFLNKVLTLKEIEEYHTKTTEDSKSIFVASRWSFKEALVKASNNKDLIFSKVSLRKEESGNFINYNKNTLGKPFALFEDDYIKTNKQIEHLLKNNDIHISISHDLDIATAIVIIQTKFNLNI